MRKITEKKKEKFLKKITWSQQKQEKKSQTINELRIYQQSKNWDIQTEMSKKKIMFSLQQEETSSQEMQNSTESNKKINENTNENNYNNRTMWERMMSKHEMSTASFKTKSSQESTMT